MPPVLSFPDDRKPEQMLVWAPGLSGLKFLKC